MMNTHDNAIPFADYFNQKGETAFSAGDMDNARRAFEKALRIFPHHIDAMNNMGVLHWQRKDYKKALDCFDTILRQHPDHGDAQHNRDQVLQAMDAGDNRFQGKHPEARLKIRILHSLTGPGGEMVAACIGSMKNVLLLHDIHPLKVTTPQALVTSDIVRKKLTMEHHPVPPRYQPESWTDAIKYLARTGEENDHHLVMHVPADMDFFEMPNAPAPTHGFSSIDALIGEFEIIQAVAVCHPITQYNHLSTGQQALSSLAVPQFLKGYRRFAEQVQAMAYIRLEDVTQIPVIALKTLCRQLDLSFDPDFFHKWHEYNLESGDYPAKSSDRHLPPGAEAFKGNRPVDTRLSDEFTGNPDFKKAISLLGYGQTAP